MNLERAQMVQIVSGVAGGLLASGAGALVAVLVVVALRWSGSGRILSGDSRQQHRSETH